MPPLSLDDPRWAALDGGRRCPYDASAALRAVESGDDKKFAWDELWDGLHHQGDVGTAAYAAIPVLAALGSRDDHGDWNLFALACVVEIARRDSRNPVIPDWCVDDYHDAWRRLFPLAIDALRTSDDESLVRSALAVIAISKGLRKSARIFFDFDESEIDEIYNQVYGNS